MASKYQVGDKVTTTVSKEAYGSRYKIVVPPYRNPEVWFEPGMVGIVAVKDSPGVSTNTLCAVVDFQHEEAYSKDDHTWRVAIPNKHVKRVKE